MSTHYGTNYPYLEEYADCGFEDVSLADQKLPIFSILQSGSPQVKKTEAEYVEGAEEGWWLDTITKELYTVIIVIPAKYATQWIEWKPRNNGGGFAGD